QNKAKPKPEPAAAAPKKPTDDDDDGPATYDVVHDLEPEEDEDEDDEDDEDYDDDEERPKKEKKNKADLTFALDTSIKDPRGPAQALIIRPTNWLMIFSAINILISGIMAFWGLFPFIFSDTFIMDDYDYA